MKYQNPKYWLEWYKSRIAFSQDLRESLVEKNLSRFRIALYFILLYGVSALLYTIFTNKANLPELRYHIIYYSLFIGISVFGIITSAIAQHFKKLPYWLRVFPYAFSFVFMTSIAGYNIGVLQNPFGAIVVYACIGMVALFCLNISPLFILFNYFLFNASSLKLIYNLLGKQGVVDFLLISVLLVAIGMYKQKITKHDFLRTKMLEENRDALQGAVADQVQEIQAQSDELKNQHQKIIDIQNNTIISLSNLVENRDSDTGEHVRRTSAYVNLLAHKAKNNGYCKKILTDDYILQLTKAAPMHDIGKIVVPDAVLKKPGKLKTEEFNEIKRHTVEGGRIVREILGDGVDKEYIQMAIDVASCHHERWDGNGYPNGLAGDDIPLSARIMAIADVFDALVSPRCYKEPFSVKKAMLIIREEAGSHFDPTLATLFVGMEDDAVAVMEKYKD